MGTSDWLVLSAVVMAYFVSIASAIFSVIVFVGFSFGWIQAEVASVLADTVFSTLPLQRGSSSMDHKDYRLARISGTRSDLQIECDECDDVAANMDVARSSSQGLDHQSDKSGEGVGPEQSILRGVISL